MPIVTPRKAAIIGASGFTGAELMRILRRHPDIEVALATASSNAGVKVAELYPSLAGSSGDMTYATFNSDKLDGFDVLFLALPHGESQKILPEIQGKVPHIVDLAADFRLDDESLYPAWYGADHELPELLAQFSYGMPELFRDELRNAEMIASPGCYVTTASLTLAPFLAEGLIETTGLIVDAASGVSGAGRPAKPATTFCAVEENFTAYGLLDHRHTPEIEMALTRVAGTDAQIIFTPHLAPMNRGILATCYARPSGSMTTDDALDALRSFYEEEPFVVVSESIPQTKSTLGSNAIHITARVDKRTGWLVAIGALDNLVKGASGQAVQCANLALGLEETAGLSVDGTYP